MKKVSSTNLNFKSNKTNIDSSQMKISGLSSSQTNINNDIKKQNTSSFIDDIKDIFIFTTKDDVVEMFDDNHLPIVFKDDIKDIQPFFNYLFVTLENGYEYTFRQDGNNIKIVQIGNSNGDYINFGSEGIDSIYDIIPATDRAGDKQNIDSIMIYQNELHVEFSGTTYVIDMNTKKVKQFNNTSLGYVTSIDLNNYINEFIETWSLNPSGYDADYIKSLYNLSAENITKIIAQGGIISMVIDDKYSLIVDATASNYNRFIFYSNGEVLFDNTED